jgi:hypothetical protein
MITCRAYIFSGAVDNHFFKGGFTGGTTVAVTVFARKRKLKMIQILNPFRAAQEFQKLKLERKWVLALVIVVVPKLLSAVGTWLGERHSIDLTVQSMEEMDVLTEGTRGIMESMQGLILIGMVYTGVVFVVIAWVFKSLIFHWLSGILGGAKVEISSTVHMVAFTYVPFIFKGLIDVYRGLTYRVPTYEQFTSPSGFTDELLNFFKEHNIFLLWAFILMIIAVREQYNLDTKRASLVVLFPYGVYFLIRIAMMFFDYLILTGI